MSGRFELAKECPELWQGQAAGRPAWQMGLREDLLRQFDIVADEARRSDEALERYIGMTAPYRKRPYGEGFVYFRNNGDHYRFEELIDPKA